MDASIETVSIDVGTFKYVLIKVKGVPSNIGESENSMYLVRGNCEGAYHADIFEDFEEDFIKRCPTLRTTCVGGGRIKHDKAKKHIVIYGYSQGYGRAEHAISCELIKRKYPDYNVEWNNEGY